MERWRQIAADDDDTKMRNSPDAAQNTHGRRIKLKTKIKQNKGEKKNVGLDMRHKKAHTYETCSSQPGVSPKDPRRD